MRHFLHTPALIGLLLASFTVCAAQPKNMSMPMGGHGKSDMPHCMPGEASAPAGQSSSPSKMSEADKILARFVTEVVTVSGSVKHPLSLRVDDLKKFPPQKIGELTMTCLDGANMGKVENLRGVLLRDIFNKAELDAPGHNDVKRMYIAATASDGYKVVFSWAEIFNSTLGDGVIVYYEKNKQPLGNDEGRIAMVSTKDTKTGPRHVKWLKSLEIRKLAD